MTEMNYDITSVAARDVYRESLIGPEGRRHMHEELSSNYCAVGCRLTSELVFRACQPER